MEVRKKKNLAGRKGDCASENSFYTHNWGHSERLFSNRGEGGGSRGKEKGEVHDVVNCRSGR